VDNYLPRLVIVSSYWVLFLLTKNTGSM